MKVENFKGFSLKMLRSEVRAFPVGTGIWLHHKSAIFTSAENTHAYESGPAGVLFLGETFVVSAVHVCIAKSARQLISNFHDRRYYS